jgi:outer membrane murein-binding lipoprotein Lpp
MTKITLLRGAAVGAVLTFGLGAAAHAADSTDCTVKCAKPVHHKHHVVAKTAENPMAGEVATLKAEVASLEQRLDASATAAQQAQAAAAQAQASAQAAETAAQNQQVAINQIPADVDGAVAKLPKPTGVLSYHGVKFTPGGFIAMEGVYRTRGLNSDGASSPGFSGIPYAGSQTEGAHAAETRFSARQSRVSGLLQADISPNIAVEGYGEFDFLGAGQTANSNESNSYNPRVRVLYTDVDFKNYGLSVLAGQAWSLVTLNASGIDPRTEMLPATIDAQYNVGFVWARQPQLRVTENFGHGFTAAVSAEMSQTNKADGTAALLPGYSVTVNSTPEAGGSLYNSLNAYSFNNAPDLVAKVAYDTTLAGHKLHAEGFGLYRNFYDRVGIGCTNNTSTTAGSATTNTGCKSAHNMNSTGGGAGGSLVAQIWPNLLDLRVSDTIGRGLGRYGSGQLSDTYEQADGALAGIRENLFLAGLTLHATKALDVYALFGMEQDTHSSYMTGTAQGGYGNPYFSNYSGCEVSSTLGNCNGNTRSLTEATIGLWDKAFSGDSFGSVRLGLQYSYIRRDSFDGLIDNSKATSPIFGAVNGADNEIYTSIRWYPFAK